MRRRRGRRPPTAWETHNDELVLSPVSHQAEVWRSFVNRQTWLVFTEIFNPEIPMSDESEHATEEDWSSIMAKTTNGFAQHELLDVHVSPTRTLTIACVPALSPLDMMNLSRGDHDATGHRIWMGAYLFVEAIAKHACIRNLFRSKRLLELGCGTGLAGLALLNDSCDAPLSVLFTDADPAALELCRRNVRQNLSSQDKRCAVAPLEWGTDEVTGSFFDVVLATDVLYDISSVEPMLRTVKSTLRPEGHFVLAHVPRACLPGEGKVGTAKGLEDYISREANKHGLEVSMVVRPSDLCNDLQESSLNTVSFAMLEDAGAAILVFKR